MLAWIRRPSATVAGVAGAAVTATAAFAYWTTTGVGAAAARTAPVQAVSLTAGTPSGELIPGGTADVAVLMDNPNPFQVRVGALALDTARGTGGFAADAGHSGCDVSALSFTAQSNGGDGWYVPAKAGAVDGTLSVDLPAAVSMAASAADACQGATLTVYLTGTPDYSSTVLSTTGLVSYWRMAQNPLAADNFTDGAGTILQSHGGTVATSWSRAAGSDAVISDRNRARRAGTGYGLYLAALAPSSADYAVEADVVARSMVSGDGAGVVGRWSAGSGYVARFQTSDNTWQLLRVVGGTETSLGSASQSLGLDQAYRLRLAMVGSALTLSVNGTVVVTATDSTITGAGRAGIQLGIVGNTAATGDGTGLHLDAFRAVADTGTAATDSIGPNVGTFTGSPALNTAGAIAGDLNGATTFSGAGSCLQVASPSGLPTGSASRSVELWFMSTASAGQALFSYGAAASGKAFAAVLTTSTNLQVWGDGVDRDFTLPHPVNNGAWHHLVVTYNGSVEQAYLDGAAIGPQSAVLNTTLDATGFAVGAVPPTADRYFAGAIDEVAVYDRVLSAGTVADHYHLGSGA